MDKEALQEKLVILETRNKNLAKLSHQPQTRQLHNDVAELADLIWNILESDTRTTK